MASDVVRNVIFGLGVALLVIAVFMLLMAGGGMILMDVPLFVIGAAMVVWAVIDRRRAAT